MPRTFVPTMFPLVSVVDEQDPATGEVSKVGYITSQWRRFQEGVSAAFSPGSIGEILSSNGTAFVWQKLQNANVAAGAAIAYAKLNLALSIMDADIALAAAIDWTKISKAASSLADLATRSASDLTSGTLAHARKWTQATITATGNQDDLAFSSADSVLANNAALLTIRGLAAGVAGQRLTLWVLNAQVDLAHQNVNSAVANRIITPTAGTITLTRHADLEYDAVTARWRIGAYA